MINRCRYACLQLCATDANVCKYQNAYRSNSQADVARQDEIESTSISTLKWKTSEIDCYPTIDSTFIPNLEKRFCYSTSIEIIF